MKASLARREETSPQSGIYACRPKAGDSTEVRSTEITEVPPRADAAPDIAELQQILRRLRDQVVEVQHLRGRMPTLPPSAMDNDGIAFAEVSLRSLRRNW